MIGVDVSHWNGAIDWQAVADAGYSFAFCKASEGQSGRDKRYQENIEGAYDAGLLVGPYHFAHPEGQDAEQEARHFLSIVGSSKYSLPPVLDLEAASPLSPVELDRWCRDWMRIVDEATGWRSILYTFPAFIFHTLRPSPELLTHPLWIADYSAGPPRIGQWADWAFWQHTAKGQVPGISTRCDLNRMQPNWQG